MKNSTLLAFLCIGIAASNIDAMSRIVTKNIDVESLKKENKKKNKIFVYTDETSNAHATLIEKAKNCGITIETTIDTKSDENKISYRLTYNKKNYSISYETKTEELKIAPLTKDNKRSLEELTFNKNTDEIKKLIYNLTYLTREFTDKLKIQSLFQTKTPEKKTRKFEDISNIDSLSNELLYLRRPPFNELLNVDNILPFSNLLEDLNLDQFDNQN